MAPFEGERSMISGLLDAFQEMPQIEIVDHQLEPQAAMDRGVDAHIQLEAAGRTMTLFVEIKQTAIYPRDVREILWRFRETDLFSKWGVLHTREIPFLAAESISPGAKELLREECVGYYDTGGSVFLPARGAFYFTDKPVPKSAAKTVRALFSGKRSQVAHALLCNPENWVNVKYIAERAEVSTATASETLSALERFDWLQTRGSGPSKERRLIEPGQLLDAWVKGTDTNRRVSSRRFYVSMMKPEEMANRIAEICDHGNTNYVVTGEAAAQQYTPYLSNVSHLKCKLSSSKAFERIIAELDARPVDEGANLLLVETKSTSEFLFREKIENVWVASPILVYLDLIRGPGRSSEMANHLRQERIGF
jgi:hypothetical protein